MLNNTYYETTYRSSNDMFVIQHISLKDIYMSYKVYATYICCVILNNIQIHFKPSRTYIYIQQRIVFVHLLLHIHYLMAPPRLAPEEGSQRFTSFLVGLLVFRSWGVTYKPAGCMSLVQNVCMCQRPHLTRWNHCHSRVGVVGITAVKVRACGPSLSETVKRVRAFGPSLQWKCGPAALHSVKQWKECGPSALHYSESEIRWNNFF